MSKKIIIIYGPTASGKTSLAVSLAKYFGTEIISADSRQIYKNLDIGTGKYTPGDVIHKDNDSWIINNVRINLYDVLNVGETYSVSQFNTDAKKNLDRIFTKNDVAIIAGGTGLYLKSLLSPIDTINIPPNYQLRDKFEKLNLDKLQNELIKLNPERFNKMNNSDKNNPRRLIRAIEVLENKSLIKASKSITEDVLVKFIYLVPDRNMLRVRTDNWYQVRKPMGLIDEVFNLKRNYSDSVINSIGLVYREINKFCNREITQKDLDRMLPSKLFQYSKNQLTWFKKFNDSMYALSIDSYQNTINKIIDESINWYNEH